MLTFCDGGATQDVRLVARGAHSYGRSTLWRTRGDADIKEAYEAANEASAARC
jgi:hypothetical protein